MANSLEYTSLLPQASYDISRLPGNKSRFHSENHLVGSEHSLAMIGRGPQWWRMERSRKKFSKPLLVRDPQKRNKLPRWPTAALTLSTVIVSSCFFLPAFASLLAIDGKRRFLHVISNAGRAGAIEVGEPTTAASDRPLSGCGYREGCYATRRESLCTAWDWNYLRTYFPGIEDWRGWAGWVTATISVLNVPVKEVVVSSYLLLILAFHSYRLIYSRFHCDNQQRGQHRF
jgi:hypothetical protein